MTFKTEAEFEQAFIETLFNKGWESTVLKNPTEQDLINNWAKILFENNNGIDRLNGQPLTDSEMAQILEQIKTLRTPLALNGFINGKTVSIKRDNPNDPAHLGKEISLSIYDRQQIAAGESRYQIVQQPKFPTSSPILNDRRGDIMLLINGMPLFHIELKRSGIPVSQAAHQIENYARSGIFSGLFSLVQIFVAMNPEETKYFANPGPDGSFNSDYYFNWADFNNEPINYWKDIAGTLLSIPMAHQLIGFYTVADKTDGVLKVMRSYQYFAVRAISDRVARIEWDGRDRLGGYIWHTTGSGKTMTSFKSAYLIATSKDADKVIFLMDRIELGTQSLEQYNNFADTDDFVQSTENTHALISKLKSTNPNEVLIVSSIQKMSNIKQEEGGLKAHDIEQMQKKRIVIIVDEAHRSTFGDMLITIKETFPQAVFFGFTGTPIQDENEKNLNTTATVFGNELHRYSIADGIRDKNVLGFDPYLISTYKDSKLREAVALDEAKANTVREALTDPKKKEIYLRFIDKSQVAMAGHWDKANNYVKGIEDYLPTEQYRRPAHQKKVVEDILENWIQYSQNNKFHGMFATSSIAEAIEYYRLFKKLKPELKITALFDPNIDNNENAKFKEDALVEIISDYNNRYGMEFNLATHAKMKRDIADRLAHKELYKRVEHTPEKQLELLIVVDQMLTGFDSKWVNTLYLDKMLEYANLIQAFSRTNRLFGKDKPFGIIRYYRRPHTMKRNIDAAVKLYSGDKPLALFVDKLQDNLKKLNTIFMDIEQLFKSTGIENFEKLPEDKDTCGQFAKLFKQFNEHLEAAKIQGFNWNTLTYHFDAKGADEPIFQVVIDEQTYLILALRYKELFSEGGSGGGGGSVPFEIDGYLTEIDTDKIDSDYMNSRFTKYLKALHDSEKTISVEEALNELHKSFAALTHDEQRIANIFLHDVQRGDVKLQEAKSFRDYITEYQFKAKEDEIHAIATSFGLDESKLRHLISAHVNENNINEFARFDALLNTVDKTKAKQYFEQEDGKSIPPFKVNVKVAAFLKEFVLKNSQSN
ncbi:MULTISPECIES: type I restriction endonuclease subunit R [Acinetobacter calcoaceticus/baumannii complex]|uniref:type I restriction endonuclease subunit R n=1 Tax=Acinetobacter calcoaceticus/baumannii complex TaxID=909768 RepID=UPI000452F2F4|nr:MULTISPECIES: HsdR family type I site-specific deoxyribonuclease [Acinetobacter calcoaceticus/baumannii complex]EXE99008.1 type I site-specific deoxyribonuclease, HsdR family protein [Acinetobacter sp. 259052]EYT20617.1 type I site-specific deoxyribonuclease, HsdR family protein [Acinetobacter sp. 1592897]KRJ11710.1 DEAD/DEAH box helicase [Acinetobacter nosocomialis]MBR7697800.1 type I restriction endonuclease subunit R [Acinetobacter nosocomialis]OUR08094.1 DEAD/DEAH box helicase [Acinetob